MKTLENIQLSQINLDDSLKLLESDPSSKFLGSRKINLARIFSIIDYLDISLSDVSFFEVGTTKNIQKNLVSKIFVHNIVTYLCIFVKLIIFVTK